MVKLTGRSIVGFQEGVAGSEHFYGVNPTTGKPLQPAFSQAAAAEIDSAAQKASEAFAEYGRMSGSEKGTFLRTIAGNVESITEELIERAHQETALPKPRLQG
jgi:NADP-dependent aldehyde dehydrogenase